MTRGRRPARSLAALAAGCLLTACGRQAVAAGGQLYWSGDERAGGSCGAFGMGQAGLKPGRIVGFGSMELCVRGGPARIDRVAFATSDHIVIDRFSVRKLDFSTSEGLGNQRGGFEVAGFAPGSTEVGTPCGAKQGPVTELALDVHSDGAARAQGHTLRITYTSQGEQRSTDVPVTVALCAGTGDCS